MEPRYRIMARKMNGEVFECFTWTRGPAEGINRAYVNARDFGIELYVVWAEGI